MTVWVKARIKLLQRELSYIAYTVAKSWNLNFNPDKCVIIRFGEQKLVREEFYLMEGKRLKFVETHKNLGIVINSGLRLHRHVDDSSWETCFGNFIPV